MRVYISGPITGIDDYMARFQIAETELREKGYKVVNPAKIGEILPDWSYEELMRVDMDILNDFCGAIYLLDGWGKSPGANREYEIARMKNMIILEEGDLE